MNELLDFFGMGKSKKNNANSRDADREKSTRGNSLQNRDFQSKYDSSKYSTGYAAPNRSHFKEVQEPWIWIDLPCQHFMYYSYVSSNMDFSNIGYIKCVKCPAMYETMNLLENFYKDNPNPEILLDSKSSSAINKNSIPVERDHKKERKENYLDSEEQQNDKSFSKHGEPFERDEIKEHMRKSFRDEDYEMVGKKMPIESDNHLKSTYNTDYQYRTSNSYNMSSEALSLKASKNENTRRGEQKLERPEDMDEEERIRQRRVAHFEPKKEENLNSVKDDRNIPSPMPRTVPHAAPRSRSINGEVLQNNNTDKNLSSSSEGSSWRQNDDSDYYVTNGGAKSKNKSLNNDRSSYEAGVCFCFTCDKPIEKSLYFKHRSCNIVPLEKGIKQLSDKVELDSLCLQEALNSKLQQIDLYEDKLQASELLFDSISTFLSDNSDMNPLKQFGGQIMSKIEKETSSCKIFAEVNSRRQAISSLKEEGERWIEEANSQIPMWLLSPWLKNSLAMLLFNAKIDGKKVFFKLNNDKPVYSELTLEGDSILQHRYKKVSASANDILLDKEIVRSVFDKSENRVFLKISHNQDELAGRVVIRLNIDSFWGLQFRDMCTGIFGKSFEDCKFFRNCYKGQSGHHLWSGDYSHNDGSGGNSMMPNSKDVKFKFSPLRIVPGLLASRFGHEDTSTIFRVYINGDAEADEEFAFGQVEDNLCILSYISQQKNATSAAIVSAGRIIKLQ